jgi:hypothetical protein
LQKNSAFDMGKVNKVISYENLTPELQELLSKKYPNGYTDHVIKVATPSKEFWAVTLDTPETSYLIKVPVKVDTNTDDLDEKDYGEDSGGNEGSFNEESSDDFDSIADDSEE